MSSVRTSKIVYVRVNQKDYTSLNQNEWLTFFTNSSDYIRITFVIICLYVRANKYKAKYSSLRV